ncbi:MAG: hypothetical protein WD605_01300, partial [Candidatus Paceibacterota bacterium]
LRSLAADSKSGKVTIVAHSNGGLLAKALVNQLENEGGSEAATLIDQIILIGSPQFGTPQAIGSLLHGFDSGILARYSDARARDFAQNAPFAYNLLPHSDYYNNSGVTISQPLISFSDGEATQKFIDAYGYGVTNATELENFLLGSEGRVAPAYSDLINPAKANGHLLNQSNNEYSAISAGWLPPAGIQIHQIAGVGERTVAGIAYKTTNYCEQAVSALNGWYCANSKKTLGYSPVRVIDGDGTVVEPSALVMSTDNQNVKRWWVDVQLVNKNKVFAVEPFRTKHKDLLEITDVRNLIFNNLLATSTVTYTYISDTKPVLDAEDRLSFTLHSPLSLSYTENDGTVVNEQNPSGRYSEYTRYGEVQVVDIFNEEGQGNIVLNGEETGSFTLEVEQYNGNEKIAATTYSGIPSSASTVATIEVKGSTIGDTEALSVDYDGDGTSDFELEPQTGEEVSLPTELPTEESEPTLEELVNELKTYIDLNVSKKSIKRQLSQQLDSMYNTYVRVEALRERHPRFAHLFNTKRLVSLQIKVIERQVNLYQRLRQIDSGVAGEIKRLLKVIESKL